MFIAGHLELLWGTCFGSSLHIQRSADTKFKQRIVRKFAETNIVTVRCVVLCDLWHLLETCNGNFCTLVHRCTRRVLHWNKLYANTLSRSAFFIYKTFDNQSKELKQIEIKAITYKQWILNLLRVRQASKMKILRFTVWYFIWFSLRLQFWNLII